MEEKNCENGLHTQKVKNVKTKSENKDRKGDGTRDWNFNEKKEFNRKGVKRGI